MYFVCNIVDVAGIEPAFANSVLSNFVRSNHFTPSSSLPLTAAPSNYLRRQALCTLADTSWLTI